MGADATLLLPAGLLLPLVAMLMLRQHDPWQALVLRGALGSLAALLYGLLGAADVALTEVLVGTLLSTALYAVAIRATRTFRLVCPGELALPEGRRELLQALLAGEGFRLELLEGEVVSEDGMVTVAGIHPMDCHGILADDLAIQLRHPSLLARLRQRHASLCTALNLRGEERP
jgi:putative multicomponent Na+:H+ antiporter subunit B